MRYRALFLGLVVLLLAASASAAPQTYEIRAGASRRVITIDDGKIVSSGVVLKEGRELLQLEGEFTIDLQPTTGLFLAGVFPIHSPEGKSSRGKVTEVSQPDPGTLILKVLLEEPKLEVWVKYFSHPEGFIEKTLTIKTAGKGTFIHGIILEEYLNEVPAIGFSGPGQPIYAGDSFFAAAYPSAQNQIRNVPSDTGTVKYYYFSCGYLLGLTVTDSYTSYSSIYGVAPAGQDVRQFFQAAVESMRARPVKPFLLWNSWYHVFDFTDQQIIAAIGDFKQKLIDPYGIRIDSFVMDDGWDDYRHVWQPHPTRFPRGFTPVADAAAAANSHLGLWMSPAGGYGFGHQKRVFFARGKGYETNKFGFCIAGRNYGRAFGDYLTSYMSDYGVNYFKFDNIDSSCNEPGHGHRTGDYAQVALTDAFIGIMERARAENPDVAINITVGSWLSPFWTLWCDYVWRTGNDFGFLGLGSPRQQSITYVDTILYQKLRVEKLQFPINSLMTHGLIKGLRQNFGESRDTPPRDFFDDLWMYFGRGVMMQELYLSPELLTDAEWKELARAIKWSHEHYKLMAASEMILGDPRKIELYGFAHELDGERLLVLRNPALKSADAPASALAGEGGWTVVYSSSGKQPSDRFDPLEVRVLYRGAK
jgi:hypothetical protein